MQPLMSLITVLFLSAGLADAQRADLDQAQQELVDRLVKREVHAASVRAEQRGLARARASLGSLETTILRYKKTKNELLHSDLGKRVTQDTELLDAFLGLSKKSIPLSAEIEDRMSSLDEYAKVLEKAVDNMKLDTQVDVVREEIFDIEQWTLPRKQRSEEWLQTLQGLREQAESLPAAPESSESLGSILRGYEAKKRAAVEIARSRVVKAAAQEGEARIQAALRELELEKTAGEEQALKQQIERLKQGHETERQAWEEEKLENERINKERELELARLQAKIRETAQEGEDDLQKRALITKAKSREVEELLRPLTDEGTYRPKGRQSITKVSHSLSMLKTVGALATNDDGLFKMAQVCCTPKDALRTRAGEWWQQSRRKRFLKNQALVDKIRRIQSLVIELDSVLVELGMLEQ